MCLVREPGEEPYLREPGPVSIAKVGRRDLQSRLRDEAREGHGLPGKPTL